MAYLSLNGVTVRVSVEGASQEYVAHGGEQERSITGALEGGALVEKREWNNSTTPVPVTESAAWVALIEGRGHSFPFDADLYSARGRGPSSGTGTIVASGAYGVASLEVLNTASVSWALGLGDYWTVLAWTNDQGGAGWKHRILRSDGGEWMDGVTSGASVGEIAVSSGSLVLTAMDGSDWLFDDVVVMPCVVPTAWVASLYAFHLEQAWPSLPRVVASGDFASESVTVRGRVTDSRVVRYSPAGTLVAGHMLRFNIREV